MKSYQEKKAEAREHAIEWQTETAERGSISYGELAEAGAYFLELGRRYGLIKEFRENGIPC